MANFPTPVVAPDPLAVIRARTRDLHKRLESSIDLTRALDSRENYARLLRRYLDIYKPLESGLNLAIPSLMPSLQIALEWPRRRKLQLIERDLTALGSAAQPHMEHRSPFALPSLNSPDSILGTLYVVEGSTLGGQILVRQVQAKLGLDEAAGTSFFQGYGLETVFFWTSFTSLLRAYVSVPERAAEAAAAVFRVFLDRLPEEPQPRSNRRKSQPTPQIQTLPGRQPAQQQASQAASRTARTSDERADRYSGQLRL